MKYVALMEIGTSQVRASLQSACEDAIRDISLGFHKSSSIYELNGWTMRYMGTVRLTNGTFRYYANGSSNVLNKNGSFRKKPEPKPFLR